MNLKQALSELKTAGTAQNGKVYGRHGVMREMFGVSYAILGKLTKQIKTDHKLALGLWDSGIHDAMVLATMIADPGKLKPAVANRWLKDVDSYVLLDGFCKIVGKTDFAMKRAEVWMKSKDEWTSNVGWGVVSHLAGMLSNAQLANYIDAIEKNIHSAPNRTRYTMNGCLIAIGVQNAAIQKKAIAAATRIGKVEVDHGQTSCKTPDAASYITKTFAHNQKKAAKKKIVKANSTFKRKTSAKKTVTKKSAKLRSVKRAVVKSVSKSRARTPSENTNAILTMICNIPRGQVASYGQIARLAGVPRNSRQVGAILRALAPNQGVPWFRVVNSNGGISPRKPLDCQSNQRIRMEDEGVEFKANGKVSLDEYGWDN